MASLAKIWKRVGCLQGRVENLNDATCKGLAMDSTNYFVLVAQSSLPCCGAKKNERGLADSHVSGKLLSLNAETQNLFRDLEIWNLACGLQHRQGQFTDLFFAAHALGFLIQELNCWSRFLKQDPHL